MERKDITNEQIIDLYFNKGLNRRQTAEFLKCSQDLICYRLKQLNLKPKSMSDCVESGKKKNVLLTNEFIEILNGEMLGDGGLIRYKNQGSFRESFGFDKMEWAKYLFTYFKNIGISIVGDKIYQRCPSGKSLNISWNLETNNIIELGDFHKKWYIKNINYNIDSGQRFGNRKYIKTIPKDLVLTKNCLLHWYIGDGTVYNNRGCMIHTEGFYYDEVEFLRYRLLIDFNILSSHSKKNTIYIPFRERVKFLEIIGECPVECYKYKWQIENKKSRIIKFNSKIYMDVVEKLLHGEN